MKTVLFCLLVFLLLVIAFSTTLLKDHPVFVPVKNTSVVTPYLSDSEKYVSGTISAVSDTQPADGNCEVTVDKMQVAIAIGGDRIPTMIPKDKGTIEGITCNTNELSQYIGRYLEAYGKWDGYYLTIEGNQNYYIKVSEGGVNKTECITAGCSGQICVEEGSEESKLVTHCAFLKEYACYKQYSTCERQANGRCGWTKTGKLESCLNNSVIN